MNAIDIREDQQKALRGGEGTREQRIVKALAHPALVLAAIGLFYLATIRSGQRWGDDFAM